MACKYIYEGITYQSKEEFISKVIPTLQSKTLAIDNSKKVILPIGISGSGKSTWIKSLDKNKYTVISPDEMRVEFTGNMDDKSKDKEIYEAVKERTIKAVNNGKQVIIDTTNLQKERRRDFLNTIKEAIPDVTLEYKLLPLNPELAKQRIKKQIENGENRANVPNSTIDRHTELYKQMLEDIKEEPLTPFTLESKENQFLQLLNKDNNWVSFFVKSIIQDSQKKGYEKVLFPVGDTAARIEGHETVQGYIDNKETRLKQNNKRLEELKTEKDKDYTPKYVKHDINTLIENSDYDKLLKIAKEQGKEEYYDAETGEKGFSLNNGTQSELISVNKENKNIRNIRVGYDEYGANLSYDYDAPVLDFNKPKTVEEQKNDLNNENNQLQKEIEDAKAGKLKISSIAQFYEKTILNILQKQYGKDNIETITDEYGNKWNQVILNDSHKDTINFNRTPPVQEKSLNDTLTTFLSKLGITIEQYDELKSITGFDAIGASDLLNKVIYSTKNNLDKILPKETAYVAYAMLGKKNKIRTDLIHSIDQINNYKELFAAYKIKSPNISNGKIKELIVIDFIADAIHNNFKSPSDSYINRKSEFWAIKGNSSLEKQFNYILARLKGFIKNLFGGKLTETQLHQLSNDIANDILTGNMDKYQTQLKSDAGTASYEETIKQDPGAEKIVETMQSHGLILTGSLALRKQGTVYRSPENSLHDLDFTVPYSVAKNLKVNDNNIQNFGPIKMVNNSEGGQNLTDKQEYSRFLKSLEKEPWYKEIKKVYPDMEVSNIFKGSTKGDITVSFKNGDYLIDFFIKTEPHDNLDTKEKGFQDWHNIFAAKVRMGRAKDMLDLVHFTPEASNNELVSGFRHFTFADKQDQVNFNRPETYQDQLDQFKQRNSLVPVTKDGIKGYAMDMAGAKRMNKQYQKSGYLYNKLNLLYNNTSQILEISPKDDNEYLQMKRSEQEQTVGTEIFDKVVGKMAEKLGVKYQIVTLEQARELTKNANHKYNDEKAFNLGGTAYVLDTALTVSNGIHEVIHPFVDAVASSNPGLFSKLVKQFISTGIGAQIGHEVAVGYEDYNELEQQKEILVIGLTRLAKNNIDQDEKDQVKSIFSKFWYEVKQFLRKLFGSSIKIGELNENNTLQELADMLTGDQFKIESVLATDKDIIQYRRDNEELYNDIANLEPGKVNELVGKFITIVQSQVGKVTKKTAYSEIKELTTADTGRNQLETFIKNLNKADKLDDSEDNMKEKVRTLTYTLAQNKIISSKILDRLKEISKQPQTQDTIQKMSYFKDILSDLEQFYKNLTKNISGDIPSNSVLSNIIGATEHDITNGLHQINKNNVPGLILMLNDQLSFTRDNIKAVHERDLKQFNDELKKGNKNAQKRIDAENERFKKFDLSDENLLKTIMGENGDANIYNGFMEAGISSSDPVVGGFVRFIKTNKYTVEAKVRDIDVTMRDELAPLYKSANINRNVPSQLGSQITFLDNILTFEEDKPIQTKVLTLLNGFKDYRYELSMMDHNIDTAEKEGDDVKALQLRRERNQFRRKYMNQEYVDSYYTLQDMWKGDVGERAKEKRTKIFDDITSIEDAMDKKDPTSVEDSLKAIDDKWREFKQLGATRDLNGNLKTGEELETAKLIQEYNEKSRSFYQWEEKKGLFEETLNQFKQSLEDKGVNSGTEEYDSEVKDWLNDNLKTTLKQNFYNDREFILKRITQILKQLPDSEAKDIETSPLWMSIIDMTKGFRDEDGQPMGADMTDEKIEKIKTAQEAIIASQGNYTKLSGLSDEDQAELNRLFDLRSSGQQLDDSEKAKIGELLTKKNEITKYISKGEFAELFGLFKNLKELQSKIPTTYYLDIVNNWLGKMDQPVIESKDAESFLSYSNATRLMQLDPEFEKWFLENHILREKWDPERGEKIPYYERIYVWSKIIPNDPKYFNTYKLSTGEVLLGVPDSRYFKRTIKDEFKTGYNPTTKEVTPIVGIHTDNKGKWLPKNAEQGKTTEGWDSKFINEAYDQLKQNKPEIYKILEVMKKYHLVTQEDLQDNNKLWMDSPRFRSHEIEYFQDGKLKEKVADKMSTIKHGVQSLFTKQKDDFNEGQGNYPDQLAERLVSTNIFNDELVKIPIKGLSLLSADQVTLDIGGAIMLYTKSSEMNKQLVKMNPVAQALLDTLEDNGIKKINDISRQLYKNRGVKELVNDDKNNRHVIIQNLYERIFLGIENQMELGPYWNKAINNLMKFSAFGSIFLSVPGSVKNMFAATVQGFIEAQGGKHINKNEYRKGLNIMTTQFAPAMFKDFNKFGNHSFETQFMRMFDFIQGKTEEKFGHEYMSAASRNVITGRFGFFGLAMGEIEAQGGFGLGLLMHQKVKQIVNGVEKEIMYKDAFEMKDGKIKLKEGIDEEWKEGGKLFNNFKLMAHSLSEKLQGNYADIDQPEMDRYSSFRLSNFMRRYFVPAFTNRLSKDRIQVGVAGTREGYYLTSVRKVAQMVKEHKVNWALYTPEEKANVFKTLSEVGVSLMFYLCLRLVGWDNNDPDKYKKLKENSWATNHLIYQLMAIKSESEQFIPIPGMGLDEIMRLKSQPSIAFGHLSKWYKLLSDVSFNTTDTLKSKQGFWDKGDSKVLVDLARISGFSGGTIDSEIQVSNFSRVQSTIPR